MLEKISAVMGAFAVILLVLLIESVILSFAWSQFLGLSSFALPEIGVVQAFWGLVVLKIVGRSFFRPSKTRILTLSDLN